MENIEITYNTILQIFGAIAVIGGGIKIIVSALSPYKDLKDKVKRQAEKIAGVESALERIEESQKVQGKALMELLNHIITGNDIDKLKERHDELVEHYIDK